MWNRRERLIRDPLVRNAMLGSLGTFVILHQGLQGAPMLESVTQPRFDKYDLMRPAFYGRRANGFSRTVRSAETRAAHAAAADTGYSTG